jgi:hypothetical protein
VKPTALSRAIRQHQIEQRRIVVADAADASCFNNNSGATSAAASSRGMMVDRSTDHHRPGIPQQQHRAAEPEAMSSPAADRVIGTSCPHWRSVLAAPAVSVLQTVPVLSGLSVLPGKHPLGSFRGKDSAEQARCKLRAAMTGACFAEEGSQWPAVRQAREPAPQLSRRWLWLPQQ